MCFTVPSSWSILNQKTGRVKGDPLVISKLLENREHYKSGYFGDGYYNFECTKKGEDMCRVKRKGAIPNFTQRVVLDNSAHT